MQTTKKPEAEFISANNKNTASATTIESHSSTTYQTTAYRSSSGAIVLNKIATTTTLNPPDAYGFDQGQTPVDRNRSGTPNKATARRKVKKQKIVVKKKLKANYDLSQ